MLKTLQKYSNLENVICACSGGVDSLSLAHLMQKNFQNVHYLIVNHNLRYGSKQEAESVRETLIKMGCKYVFILHWEHETQETQTEESARKARYNLIFDYAFQNEIRDIFLGHQLEDNLENFFLKLSRGSGISGLTSLKELKNFRWNGHNFRLIRPFIEVSKTEIITYATENNLKFVQDETNFENFFKRNRLRKVIPEALKTLEILQKNLIQTIKVLESQERIIEKRVDKIFESIINFDNNFAFFSVSKADFQTLLSDEIFYVITRIIFYFSGKTDVRKMEITRACKIILTKPTFTLGGVEVFERKERIYFIREASKINEKIIYGIWDLRFKIGILPENTNIKPIDFSLKKVGIFSNLPAKIIKTLPAIWKEEKLLALPNFGFYNAETPIFFEINDASSNTRT